MIAGDAAVLDEPCSDDLIYTHAVGTRYRNVGLHRLRWPELIASPQAIAKRPLHAA